MLESVSEVLNTIIDVFVLASDMDVESFPATMELLLTSTVISGTVEFVSDVVVLKSVSAKETELFCGTVESFPGNVERLMESFPGNVERLMESFPGNVERLMESFPGTIETLSFVIELFPNVVAVWLLGASNSVMLDPVFEVVKTIIGLLVLASNMDVESFPDTVEPVPGAMVVALTVPDFVSSSSPTAKSTAGIREPSPLPVALVVSVSAAHINKRIDDLIIIIHIITFTSSFTSATNKHSTNMSGADDNKTNVKRYRYMTECGRWSVFRTRYDLLSANVL